MGEEKDKADDTTEQDWDSQPSAIEKSIKSAAIGSDDALNEIAGPFFHPRPFMAGPAFAKNARAHQWSQGQGNKTRGENRHDDGDRKFLEDASE